jgi:adenine phosphoribosyltransferase
LEFEKNMTREMNADLRDFIRAIPDFPKPGILFRDITPLLSNPDAFHKSIDLLCSRYAGMCIDTIVAAEARGFIFGAPMAIRMGLPFVPIRKPGKLPYESMRHEYDLEYGTDTLEMHIDAISAGNRVLVVDDLLATGGTVNACCTMVEKAGGKVVECAFIIELVDLGGRKKLEPHQCFSLLTY